MLIAAVGASHAHAQDSGEGTVASQTINESNNPLNPAFVLNTQDYYLPKLRDAPGLGRRSGRSSPG